MSQIDLSVAMIFKNEIRCLERCLKSLQPLRERLSMEIVMADTGSDDGSEKIAAKYADILFDFPWINDFSAARNAVLDRCSGRWILIMDADTWLDENIEPLVALVLKKPEPKCDYVMALGRNYNNVELSSYTETLTSVLLRSAAKPRYYGKIHEAPLFGEKKSGGFAAYYRDIIIHHDGYVMLNAGSEAGRQKLSRNTELLKKEIAEHPDDLRSISQYMDCAGSESDYMDVVRRAVELVRETKNPNFGPVAMVRAVQAGYTQSEPNWIEWAELATELYPDNYLVTVDIAYITTMAMISGQRYEETEKWGRAYLRARRKMETDKFANDSLRYGSLLYGGNHAVCSVRLAIATARTCLQRYNEAYATLAEIDFTDLPSDVILRMLHVVEQLFLLAELDFSGLMQRLWDGVSAPGPTELSHKNRINVFLSTGKLFFGEVTGAGGTMISTGAHKPWEIFLPLKGQCVLGDSAALLKCETAEEADTVLATAENPNELLLNALAHALRLGARFPAKPLSTEEADMLAVRLVENTADYPALVIASAARLDSLRRAHWARGLALAAVHNYDWKSGGEDALPLARAFAAVERAYLTLCYTPEALAEQGILPPMHRFALACAAAFDALDAERFTDCVRALHDALSQSEDMRDMVAFLLDETARQEKAARIAAAPPELKQLAEQVRAILKNCDPDSPEVRQIKESPAYRKVAYLIEE